MIRRLVLATMLLSLAARHAAVADDAGGAWAGTYRCGQGLTALDLELWEDAAGHIDGLFHFSADPGNPGVPEGCYSVRGERDKTSDRLDLLGVAWLLQPAGYVMVDLAGTLAGEAFAGRIMLPGCATFTLRRVARIAARPRACAPAGDKVA